MDVKCARANRRVFDSVILVLLPVPAAGIQQNASAVTITVATSARQAGCDRELPDSP
jgi:hypothetical protein